MGAQAVALTLHPVPGKMKSKMICEMFATGAPHGAEGHVFYGVTEGNLDAWRKVTERGLPYWYIDNSYFDKVRGVQFRVTKNALQHSGISFDTTGERFAALGVEVQPERTVTSVVPRVLAVHQSDQFMNLIVRNPHWMSHTLALMPEFGMAQHRRWASDKVKLSQTLQQAFAEVDLVVTHSSAAAVGAVLAGLQVVVSHMSAAYAIYTKAEWDRRQWAGVLADNQFTLDEMKDGTAWHMLARI